MAERRRVDTMVPSSVLYATGILIILVAISSIAGLTVSGVYAAETDSWRLQAQGQDVGNLVAIAVLTCSTIAAARGSQTGMRLWVGAQVYISYAMAIYAFTIHFGPLFLIYTAALGVSVYSTGYVLIRLQPQKCGQASQAPWVAWLLAIIGGSFALLWLSAIVPAQFAGITPQDLVDAGLSANPVHVLDLAWILPGMIVTAVGALRGNLVGRWLVTSWLVFSALMALSIVAGMILMAAPLMPTLMLVVIAVISAIGAYASRGEQP